MSGHTPWREITRKSQTRRLRFEIRDSKHGAPGYALGYGVRVGYWPCLKAPYIQIAWHRWRLELWFGLPSYQDDERKISSLKDALLDCVDSLEYVQKWGSYSGSLTRAIRIDRAKEVLAE